jgi:TPR repeat protein
MPALKRALEVYENTPADAVPQLSYLADSGSPMGMIFLGHAYQAGTGVPKDPSVAESWYRRAADLGSVLGLHELGSLYIEQERYAEAKEAFRFASAAGYAPATYHLGRMYRLGLGVEKDIRKTKTLWEDASANGHVFAERHLATLFIQTHVSTHELLWGIFLIARSIVRLVAALWREGLGSDRLRY